MIADTISPLGLASIVLLNFLAFANSDADSQLLTIASNATQDALLLLDLEPASPNQVSIDRLTVRGIDAVAALVAVSVPGLAALFSMLGSWFAILGFAVVASM